MTDTTPWAPLSRRTARLSTGDLTENIPRWLYPKLQEWLYQILQSTYKPIRILQPGQEAYMTNRIMGKVRTDTVPWLLAPDDSKFLDAIDATIRFNEWRYDHAFMDYGDPGTLEELLVTANFAWRATWKGLERRIDATTAEAVGTTIRNATEEAAEHLAAAWAAVYGRHPDADKAYAEAVKAVEATACRLVLPTNPTATLGQVRNHLRDAPTKWEIVLPDKNGALAPATVVMEMMTALWEGQRSRHAGTPTSRRQQSAEAAAAVHLAATLMNWLTSGVLRRKTP